jgi:hypothetical protein
MLFISVLQTRLVIHEVLVAVFMVVTTAITLMLLARAALYRDRQEGSVDVPMSQPLPSTARGSPRTKKEGDTSPQDRESWSISNLTTLVRLKMPRKL